jgi:hypothetical protein
VIRFDVKGNVINLACVAENGLPLRTFASYRWKLKGKTLTLTKITDRCTGSNGVNQAFLLTTHPWHKVAGR